VLEPQLAQSLAIAFHELTTNAVKYGALSVPTGRLEVDWQAKDNQLRVRWIECGGPPVTKPTRHGFGTDVIGRMIREQLQGDLVIDWRPEGLSCELSVRQS
jgi:two-component sensor histidine kinase